MLPVLVTAVKGERKADSLLNTLSNEMSTSSAVSRAGPSCLTGIRHPGIPQKHDAFVHQASVSPYCITLSKNQTLTIQRHTRFPMKHG